jgi:hypothetical protein
MTTANGAPAAASATIDRQRVRALVRQIAASRPRFRGVLCALRRDLGELVELTGTDASSVFARLDGLDRDVADLLYWASGGKHDAHCRDDACDA